MIPDAARDHAAPPEAPDGADRAPRVLIVGENASARFGGEAVLPWHYFRLLRKRGVEAWLLAHDRTRNELTALLPGEADRMSFVPDTKFDRKASRLGARLPARLAYVTVGGAARLKSQLLARTMARRLVREHRIDVIHEPIPVGPRIVSVLHDMGAPVVIGPMNGNMSFPPGFGYKDRAYGLMRKGTNAMNRLFRGKLKAEVLLVANERTRRALPSGCRGEVIELVENGVDFSLWSPAPERPARPGEPVRFLAMGRLVDWKVFDVALDALARVQAQPPPTLDILGRGPMREPLEQHAARLGLGDRVRFLGWKSQEECSRILPEYDALIHPAIYECGGAVVLEAMASGLTAVVADWGGPADYLDPGCGFLIPPTSREDLVDGFVDAMTRLALDPELRRRLGRAALQKVRERFDWEAKIDAILDVYGHAMAARRRTSAS
ncbi:Glycogen synthase [Aquisphaera giovannonii]|uniref:Glycogen synthase n=1 Tax=Aquisphaera giovannonii TaxID=406548 RepID=A0A5B9W4K8_9BACT|nr:glycosyltransferase family 4 protein [Aquisphaera giovannonii]QEH35167.1 Glycogen synthase [Aquisphaera giovannonii]